MLTLKTINSLFSSQKRFQSFLVDNNLDLQKKYFIQIFTGSNDPEKLESILCSIKELLPASTIIATSTAGEIVEGGMVEDRTVVSISSFEDTEVNVQLIEGDSEKEIAQTVLSTMVTDRTKLIIAFNNVFANDGEKFLEALEEKTSNVTVAGGNAGDSGKFYFQTVVGVNDKVSTTAIAVATFDSDVLQVFNDYLFNWQTIGESMKITKAVDSVIYEIDNQKAQDVYKIFLGEEVAKNLPFSGIEFPLIFNEDNIDIARAPVAVGDDGSLVMAGHIKEGSTVKFGFGDVAQNDKNVAQSLNLFAQNPLQSIFIYSCSARKYFFKEHLNSEFEMLQQIAPTAGFITYGEFFKQDSCNKMLNVSSTFIGLSEDSSIKHDINFVSKDTNAVTRTLNALTHLVKQTSKRIEEKNLSLNQFKNLIKESTLYSSTDTKGIITDVNEQFIKLSGYSRDELIGKQHNIVRHSDMPSSVYADMWSTIKAKKSWKGIVKNKAKNGSTYYVRSNVFPLLNTNNEIVEYVSIRDNITEEMERKEFLEGSLDVLEEKTLLNDYMLNQYQNIINANNSFFRINQEYNFVYVNDVFSDIFKLSKHDIRQMNLKDIIEKEYFDSNFESNNKKLIENGIWSGVVPFVRADKTILYMNTSANPIYDKDNNLLEIMVVMNDITDVIVAQNEIENAQRDIVYAMGAIAESRSKETGNHVKRVALYSQILAQRYGLDKKTSKLLKMASPMHDIGKVGIPDSILNKPGKLTDDEWKIMKTHSALGYQMLKHSKREILKTAALVSYTHHEKWDGSGYPKGLKGEDIHIFGRITALADVFDALGSDRCYKKAWEDEKIFQLIKDGSGQHFDPKLVSIFFEHLNDFLTIRSRFK